MNIIQPVIDFFNHPIFIIVGGITVLAAVLGLFCRITCITLGVSPLVFRMGKALWLRKIAIIGDADAYSSLQGCIVGAGIFKENNIIHIPVNNIDEVKAHTILLVDWKTSSDQINYIFTVRQHHTAVIIFAEAGSIPQETMREIGNKPNTVVVNFKGRLLNDIFNSLLTTSFKER